MRVSRIHESALTESNLAGRNNRASVGVMKAPATTTLSLAEIKAVARSVCAEHPVARLELFGSRARGLGRPNSDVDLMVEFLPEANPGLLAMGALQDDLQQQLGLRVDLVSRRAVERSRNPYRRRAMLHQPVTLYAR